MQTNKKKVGPDEPNEIEMGRNEEAEHLENFDDRILRDLVGIASSKAGKDFDAHSNLKSLADLPKLVREEIVDVQVRLHRSGVNDDAGRPIIDFSYSLEFREFDILRELERRGKEARAFTE